MHNLYRGPGEAFAKSCRKVLEWLEDRLTKAAMLFTVSFTERGNILSQWRGYCPAGVGVSLGFSPIQLSDIVRADDFLIGRCIYEEAEHRKVATAVSNILLDVAYQAVQENEGYLDYTSLWPTLDEFAPQVVRICALMKHPSFQEEHEWRCVSQPFVDVEDERIRYRPGNGSLVPFISLPLPRHSGRLSLEKVYVGPSPTPEKALASTSMFLQRHQPFDLSVVSCDIPYRP
jgi:hypothetical protein